MPASAGRGEPTTRCDRRRAARVPSAVRTSFLSPSNRCPIYARNVTWSRRIPTSPPSRVAGPLRSERRPRETLGTRREAGLEDPTSRLSCGRAIRRPATVVRSVGGTADYPASVLTGSRRSRQLISLNSPTLAVNWNRSSSLIVSVPFRLSSKTATFSNCKAGPVAVARP